MASKGCPRLEGRIDLKSKTPPIVVWSREDSEADKQITKPKVRQKDLEGNHFLKPPEMKYKLQLKKRQRQDKALQEEESDKQNILSAMLSTWQNVEKDEWHNGKREPVVTYEQTWEEPCYKGKKESEESIMWQTYVVRALPEKMQVWRDEDEENQDEKEKSEERLRKMKMSEAWQAMLEERALHEKREQQTDQRQLYEEKIRLLEEEKIKKWLKGMFRQQEEQKKGHKKVLKKHDKDRLDEIRRHKEEKRSKEEIFNEKWLEELAEEVEEKQWRKEGMKKDDDVRNNERLHELAKKYKEAVKRQDEDRSKKWLKKMTWQDKGTNEEKQWEMNKHDEDKNRKRLKEIARHMEQCKEAMKSQDDEKWLEKIAWQEQKTEQWHENDMSRNGQKKTTRWEQEDEEERWRQEDLQLHKERKRLWLEEMARRMQKEQEWNEMEMMLHDEEEQSLGNWDWQDNEEVQFLQEKVEWLERQARVLLEQEKVERLLWEQKEQDWLLKKYQEEEELRQQKQKWQEELQAWQDYLRTSEQKYMLERGMLLHELGMNVEKGEREIYSREQECLSTLGRRSKSVIESYGPFCCAECERRPDFIQPTEHHSLANRQSMRGKGLGKGRINSLEAYLKRRGTLTRAGESALEAYKRGIEGIACNFGGSVIQEYGSGKRDVVGERSIGTFPIRSKEMGRQRHMKRLGRQLGRSLVNVAEHGDSVPIIEESMVGKRSGEMLREAERSREGLKSLCEEALARPTPQPRLNIARGKEVLSRAALGLRTSISDGGDSYSRAAGKQRFVMNSRGEAYSRPAERQKMRWLLKERLIDEQQKHELA